MRLRARRKGWPAKLACGLFVELLVTVGFAPAASAASGFIVSPPILDDQRHGMVFLVGGLSADRTTLKPSAVTIEIDGQPVPVSQPIEVFSEHAQAAAAASRHWKPPLAVGLVCLWVKDIPAGIADAILEGIGGFFRRIPGRTHVYATLYGRKRQPIPRLKASEIAAQLHDIGFLGGDRPNLADAIRLDRKALLGDESPFKVLVVVTDGRDHDDFTGDNPADFVRLADQIRSAGIQLLLVSFAPFAADAEQSRKNLVDLSSSGAIRRAVESPLGMQAALEALGQAIADLRRVRVAIPWGWRNLGGTRRIRLDLTIDGKQRVVEVGEVMLPARRTLWLLALGGVVGVLLLAAGAVLYWRYRSNRAGDEEHEDPLSVVVAAHSLIERGLSAARALVELTRKFPKTVPTLATLDASVLADERFPLFQTRPGRRRLEELQRLLSHPATDDRLLGDELAEILSQSISRGTPAERAASTIAARVPEDQWGVLARMGLDELAHALRVSGVRHPVLASPQARGVALQIQAALRKEGRRVGKVVAVGWLVRVAGYGRRGESVRLPVGRAVLGHAPGCDVRIDGDTQIASLHAAITEQRGSFFIDSMQGEVRVEASPVCTRTPLRDGDTIEIGRSRFVFKCVASGHTESR